MRSTLWNGARSAVAFLMFAVVSAPAYGQSIRERELQPAYDFTLIQSPVEILSIKLNGEEVAPGEKIKAGDDWLRGATFTLKNISDKSIAYVAITLQFSRPEEAKHPSRIVGYFLSYGLDITSERYPLPANAPRAIQPGEIIDVVLSKEKYPVLLKILSHGEMTTDVATAKYYIHSVAFENEPDLRWQGGKLMARDSGDRNKFNVIGSYTLPGRQ